MQEKEEAEETQAARSFVGTAEYVSPELLKSDPVSKEADFWAFGCVVYQMLSGKSPFKAPTDYLIFQKIKNLEYVFPDDFPLVGKDLVEKLLTSDPSERWGSDIKGGVQAIKDHAFFKGVAWDTLFTSNAPPLKERLEEETRKNPVPSPKYNFEQEQEEEDEEEMWLNQQKSNAPVLPTQQQPIPQIITTTSTSSYHHENNTPLFSAASSVNESRPTSPAKQPTW